MKITIETTRGFICESSNIPDEALCDFLKLISKTITGVDGGETRKPDPLADAIIDAAKERSRRANAAIPNDEDDEDVKKHTTLGAAEAFLKTIETLDTWVYMYACEPKTVEDAVLLTAASFKDGFTVKQLGEACKKVFNVQEDSEYLAQRTINTARAIVADPHFVCAGQSADSLETLYEISAKGWARCWEIVQDKAPRYFNDRVANALKKGIRHIIYV